MKSLAFFFIAFVLTLSSCFSSKNNGTSQNGQTQLVEKCWGEAVGIVFFKPCFLSQSREIGIFNLPGLEQAKEWGEIDFVVGSVVGEPQKTEHDNGGITFRGTPGDQVRYYIAVLRKN